MKTEAYSRVGFFMVLLGIGSLVGTNLWLVPRLEHHAGASEPTIASSKPASPATPTSSRASGGEETDPDPSPSAESQPARAEPEQANASTPAVRFPIGKIRVDKELVQAVEPVAQQLRATPSLRVVIIGHGDDPSNLKEYHRLGRTRAALVARIFVDLGIGPSKIAVEAPNADNITAAKASLVELRLAPRTVKEKGERHVP